MTEEKRYIVIPKFFRYIFSIPMIVFAILLLLDNSWSSITSSKPWGVFNLIMAFAIIFNVGGLAFLYGILMVCFVGASFLMKEFDLGIIGWIIPFALVYLLTGISEKFNIVFDDDPKVKNRDP